MSRKTDKEIYDHAKRFVEDKKLDKQTRQRLAAFYGRDMKHYDASDGLTDMARLWEDFRFSTPELRPQVEREIQERGQARERQTREAAAAKEAQRQAEMKKESPRQSVMRSLEESRGNEFHVPEAPRNERVGDTIRRSIAEIGERAG